MSVVCETQNVQCDLFKNNFAVTPAVKLWLQAYSRACNCTPQCEPSLWRIQALQKCRKHRNLPQARVSSTMPKTSWWPFPSWSEIFVHCSSGSWAHGTLWVVGKNKFSFWTEPPLEFLELLKLSLTFSLLWNTWTVLIRGKLVTGGFQVRDKNKSRWRIHSINPHAAGCRDKTNENFLLPLRSLASLNKAHWSVIFNKSLQDKEADIKL